MIATRPHPHAGTPQYGQAYPPPIRHAFLRASRGRKARSGDAALGAIGNRFRRIVP